MHLVLTLAGADSKEPIGTARIEKSDWGNVRTATIGTYIGKKEMWEKGLGHQITVALLEMCFNQLNMKRCDAWSGGFNNRAHKVLESCGFKKAGSMREAAFVNGRKWDGYYFDVLRSEYLNIRSNLLRQTLGDKSEDYIKRHCTIKGY